MNTKGIWDVNRKRLIKLRIKLSNEITDLGKVENYRINKKREIAKDKYKFINNLLKVGV